LGNFCLKTTQCCWKPSVRSCTVQRNENSQFMISFRKRVYFLRNSSEKRPHYMFLLDMYFLGFRMVETLRHMATTKSNRNKSYITIGYWALALQNYLKPHSTNRIHFVYGVPLWYRSAFRLPHVNKA
jgi:hypothetical protein